MKLGLGIRVGAQLIAPLLFFPAAFAQQPPENSKFVSRREAMVRQDIEGRGVRDVRVLQAMREIPRELFVPESIQKLAYEDRPLPIGEGQTISQPYVVAYMTLEGARVAPSTGKAGRSLPLNAPSGLVHTIPILEKVLEIGTGSGYQAAVLSKIAKEVYTIEIRESLASTAAARLKEMGYANVSVKHADGYFGWPEKGPFDAIMITAAANHIPPPLLKQLKEGGRLILPLGSTVYYQTLVRVTKRGEKFDQERLIDVRFVPMTGEAEKKK